MSENILNQRKETDIQVQESHKVKKTDGPKKTHSKTCCN